MNTYHAGAAALLLMLSAVPALAQGSNAGQAENRLGLLKFCQGRGYVDASAISAQKRVLDGMGISGADIDGSTAENMGEKGFVTGAGGNTTLDRVAASRNESLQGICVEMAGGRGGSGQGQAPSQGLGIPPGIGGQAGSALNGVLGRLGVQR